MSKATHDTTTSAAASFDPLAYWPGEKADVFDWHAAWFAAEGASRAALAAGGRIGSVEDEACAAMMHRADRALRHLMATRVDRALGLLLKTVVLRDLLDRGLEADVRLMLASIEADAHHLNEIGLLGR